MIYTVSEWLATISESLIIFFFLVKILPYKNMKKNNWNNNLLLFAVCIFFGIESFLCVWRPFGCCQHFNLSSFLLDIVRKTYMVSDNCRTSCICLLVYNQHCCNVNRKSNYAKYFVWCTIFTKSSSHFTFIYHKSYAGFYVDDPY